MSLKSGYLIDNFKIDRLIGSGGFSNVYLATNIINYKKYAIKEYYPYGLATRIGNKIIPISKYRENFIWAKNKFMEEAQILVRFNNPNIVDIVQVCEIDENAYLIMEFIEGTTINNWLKQIEDTANQIELDLIIKPILNALKLIHKNKLLHRDISPDNIILRKDLSPVLIDFGAAREALSRKQGVTSAIVKDGLSPPEQYSITGENQGPWSDIYSLSATIYYSITKKFPTQSTIRIINDDLMSLNYLYIKGYRKEFLQAIEWGLQLEIKNRPKNVEEWQNLIDMN